MTIEEDQIKEQVEIVPAKKAKKDKSICKAINQKTGQPCIKKAMLGGYCTIHYMALGYKENKKLKKEKKAKDKLEKQRKRQEERQKNGIELL